MLNFKLINNIVISKESTLIGNQEIKNEDFKFLAKIMESVTTPMYIGLHKVEIILMDKILNSCRVGSNIIVPLELANGYTGALIDSLLVLVDKSTEKYAYKTIIGNDAVRGTLELTDEDLDVISEKVNKELSVNFADITIKRDNDNLIIYHPQGTDKIAFKGKFSDVIFDKVDTSDWSLGSLQFADSLKDEIVAKVNALFNYTVPAYEKVPLECCCFSGKTVPVNELFGSVREANKEFNTEVSNNNKEISKLFWRAFNTKLELLRARGYDITAVLKDYNNFADDCLARNYKKSI